MNKKIYRKKLTPKLRLLVVNKLIKRWLWSFGDYLEGSWAFISPNYIQLFYYSKVIMIKTESKITRTVKAMG